MRLIETKMNKAIRRGGNFSNGNTSVQTVSYLDSLGFYREESKVFLHGNHIATYDHTSKVFLHGNHIATYDHTSKELYLFDGGWQSNTTKSRLNALCQEFATGFTVFQKNWNWFVSDFQSKVVKDFTNGIAVNYNGCF